MADTQHPDPGARNVERSSEGESTADLARMARDGDRDALDRLFSRYVPVLRRWARGRLPVWARDLADTSDIVQETVVAAFSRLDTFEFRGEGAFQAYLRQSLMNRIRLEFRRAGRRPPFAELSPTARDPGPSPLEAAIGRENVERYETALTRIKPVERELIVARVEFGLTYEEVARAFDKPSKDAARMAVARALARLVTEMT